MKRFLIVLVAAGACAPAEGSKPDDKAAAGRQTNERMAPKTRATRVEIAVMGESNATLDLVLPGEVIGSRTSQLAAANGGYVERVLVDVGDKVKAGQSLAYVDRATAQVRLDQAKVQVEQAENDLAAVERAGRSVAKTRRDAAKFGAEGARAAFRLAQIAADRATVRAPFSGVIASKDIEQGEVLGPGGKVMRLVRLNPIHVSLSVSDRDVVNLKKGVPVKVDADARTGLLDGVIHRVSPAAELDTRTFEVLVEVKNDDLRLRPGMIATVRTRVDLESNAISIPQYVLVTKLDGVGVFVEENGVARWRPVELGNLVRGQIIVESGISVGDRVIVTGHRELADGDKLLVAREGRCCEAGQIVFGEK